MADVTDSKSVGATRVGSSPTTGTSFPRTLCSGFFCMTKTCVRPVSDCSSNERSAIGMHEGAAAPSYAIRSGGVYAARRGGREARRHSAFSIIWSVPKGRARNDAFRTPSAARMRSRLAAKSCGPDMRPARFLCCTAAPHERKEKGRMGRKGKKGRNTGCAAEAVTWSCRRTA